MSKTPTCWRAGKDFLSGLDPGDVGWVVQRGECGAALESGHDLVADLDAGGELFGTMHDAVPDGLDLDLFGENFDDLAEALRTKSAPGSALVLLFPFCFQVSVASAESILSTRPVRRASSVFASISANFTDELPQLMTITAERDESDSAALF